MDPKETAHLRHRLLERRKQTLEIRRTANRSWHDLQQPEVEFEETAQKEKMSQGLEQLSEQELREVRAIDAALDKMDEGTYGICESCGKPISVERLKAIPWTEVCSRCAAQQQERKETISPDDTDLTIRDELPPEYQDMSDEQLQEAIFDTLRADGRIELEELDISCRDGIVYLEGALPSETKHHMLLQVLEDTMALPNIIDHLEIDPLPWQRTDRPPPEEVNKREYQEELWGEGENEDVAANTYESRKIGTTVTPPDKLVPEKND